MDSKSISALNYLLQTINDQATLIKRLNEENDMLRAMLGNDVETGLSDRPAPRLFLVKEPSPLQKQSQ